MKDEYKEMVCRVRFIDGVHAQTYLSDVEIVRCKDCARNDNCFMYRESENDYGFCSWAERKEE